MGKGTLVERIVWQLSGRTAASGGLFVPSTIQYDYAIGGIPFLSAASDNRPDTEKPVQLRKQQFDNQKNPGEYSLTQWWLRSQASYVGGAGVVYQDPDTGSSQNNTRYAKSIGVNPFADNASISLLKETELASAIGGTNFGNPYVCAQSTDPTNDTIYVARGATVEVRNVTANDLVTFNTATLTTSGPTQQIIGGIIPFIQASPTSASTFPFACVFMQDLSSTTNSGVWRIDRNSSTPTKIYNAPTNINYVTLGKARGLLMFAQQNNLWALDPYVASATAIPATPNATVPQDQQIISITDGPDAVYVAANDGVQGYIYKSTFNSTTGVINGLVLTAVLPAGEQVNDIHAYINTYLVISTSSSVRVGQFTIYGIQYGPQLITPLNIPTNLGQDIRYTGYGKITIFGQLAFVATGTPAQHDGQRGLMCVNLGELISDQVSGLTFNPYCTWNYFPSNIASLGDACVTLKGKPVFTTGFGTSAKVYVEHSTTLISTGYLDTGRCRFNTIEPKLFKYFSIRTPTPLNGNLNVSVLDDSGGITSYITYGPTIDPGTSDIATPTPGGPRNWEALRFTLSRSGTDVTTGAIMNSWQIKALPGVLRQRLITRQLLCFNEERDKGGNLNKGDTLSLDCLIQIRQMCQSGDTVTYQDLSQGISTQVIIDDYQFTMMAPPGPNKENFGGYLTVVLRTIADAVPGRVGG